MEQMQGENLENKMLGNLGYKVNNRTYKHVVDIADKFSISQKGFSFSDFADDDVIYSGAEHTGNPKLPNITVLPNITFSDYFLFGSTFGHQHTQFEKKDDRAFQEIYEFWGNGAILLRNNSETALYILSPEEKVIVGTKDDMTLFNLDDKPLVTLDYANPDMNSANKDLEKRIGPLMLIQGNLCNGRLCGIDFKINENYVSEGILKPEGGIKPYCQTKQGLENFIEYLEMRGIALRFGSNVPDEYKSEFSSPLLNLVLNKNKILFGALGMLK